MSNEEFQAEIDALRTKLQEARTQLLGEEKIFYICATEWDYELPEKAIRFFKSAEDLKTNNPCWEECGIYKVTCRAELAGIQKEMKLGEE